jgi:hypothetical protein
MVHAGATADCRLLTPELPHFVGQKLPLPEKSAGDHPPCRASRTYTSIRNHCALNVQTAMTSWDIVGFVAPTRHNSG